MEYEGRGREDGDKPLQNIDDTVDTQMLPLQRMLDALMRGTKMRISVQDLTGILQGPMHYIAQDCRIHKAPVCDWAKGTRRGLSLCMRCKARAVSRAVQEKTPFWAVCPVGIHELTYPVVKDGKTAAIVYVGNWRPDEDKWKERARHAALFTGVETEALHELSETVEGQCSREDIEDAARAAAGYLQLLPEESPLGQKNGSAGKREHPLVQLARDYAEEYYASPITVRELGRMYAFHSQYAGRILKQALGMSFHAYLNQIRIQKACTLLRETAESIIHISARVGFENVTYFNRVFRQLMDQTPGDYRNAGK